MKAARFPALGTGRLYPPSPQELSLVLISVRGLVDPSALVKSMKNSSDPVGNRPRNVPASGTEPPEITRVALAYIFYSR